MLRVKPPFRVVVVEGRRVVGSWRELVEVCPGSRFDRGAREAVIDACREPVVVIAGGSAWLVEGDRVEEARLVPVRRLGGGWMRCVKRRGGGYVLCL